MTMKKEEASLKEKLNDSDKMLKARTKENEWLLKITGMLDKTLFSW